MDLRRSSKIEIKRRIRFGLCGLLGAIIISTSCAPATDIVSEFEPVDPMPNKQRLLNYLADNYGECIISGQMDTYWHSSGNRGMDMIARVYEDTGKFPAIKGFDLQMLRNDYAPYYGGMQQIEEAIEWWEGKNSMNGAPSAPVLPGKNGVHGIVTFCWHWEKAKPGTGRNHFYTENTEFRIPWKNGGLDTESQEFEMIVSDLDEVAALFMILKEKEIPVLWRPLHEAAGNWRKYGNTGNDGAWFWWGASGPEPYKALWEFMYSYFTYEKGLNNLIWVWNAQNGAWFPHPDTVELVGCDSYAKAGDITSMQGDFSAVKNMIPVKHREKYIIALSENGVLPDPDKCRMERAMWSYFMTWNDAARVGETSNSNFWSGEYHNSDEQKRNVYNHQLVITLDELPDLTTYRLY